MFAAHWAYLRSTYLSYSWRIAIAAIFVYAAYLHATFKTCLCHNTSSSVPLAGLLRLCLRHVKAGILQATGTNPAYISTLNFSAAINATFSKVSPSASQPPSTPFPSFGGSFVSRNYSSFASTSTISKEPFGTNICVFLL